MSLKKKTLIAVGLLAGFIAAGTAYVFMAKLDAERLMGVNNVLPHEPYVIEDRARALHKTLRIADWHADTLMWLRDLLDREDIGQVDVPRLRDGNVALQVFTSVTKVPSAGLQQEGNADEGDQISSLAFTDKWPGAARYSLLARARFHAAKMHGIVARAPDQVKLVRNQVDLDELLTSRANGGALIGAILGLEGLHTLEGKLENIDVLWEDGFRVMGLFHYFDNELGTSLHGTGSGGLSEFGKDVIRELSGRGAIIDLAHASEASVSDVLDITDSSIIISHTGMRGVCDSPRNISDEMMKRVAERGGLIGIGYFEFAICQMSPASVVAHIRYAIDLLGVDHVSLGSDYDGTVDTPFDVSEIAVLTQTMLDEGFSEQEIRAVMGENMLRFLRNSLPES